LKEKYPMKSGIKIFEGPRNSGKTFLALKYSEIHNVPVFKFDFVGWFNRLCLDDQSRETHIFALGKELMLLQLCRDGLLPNFILDRGFLTVLTWGILSGRITENEAINQLKMISGEGLLENCEIYFVTGNNPNKGDRNKDNWDFRDGDLKELEIMERLLEYILSQPYNVSVHRIYNSFDNKSVNYLSHI
jgi:hypothetical protein